MTMHGRPRKTPTPEDAAASAAKAAKLRDLQAQLLHNHHQRIYTKEALEVSLKLLQINPEVLYGWNYRRLALQHNLTEAASPEAVKSLVDEELKVVEIALRRNPKSYGAWYHRKWLLRRQFSPVDFDREFRLVEQLLEMDQRNFHGWNYRRFIAALKGVSEAEELQFTGKMIDKNFSNYSAWHNRSVLLSNLLKEKAEGYASKEEILTDEYDLVHQALFTDAGDQSGWFYHLWLLKQIVPQDLLLVSSWPVDGSDWVLSTNENTGDYRLFPSMSPNSYYSLHTGTLPIILFFNQAVKGVSSSTIIVKSTFAENEHIIWRSISTQTPGESHCWVTYLKIPDIRPSSLEAHSVEVNLGHSQDIIGSSGSYYSHPSQLKFTIKLKSTEPDLAEQESYPVPMVWDDDNICSPEEIPTVISFDQRRIRDDHVLEPSKWHIETLSNEINLFKELYEENLLVEENSKFVMLTLARLHNAYDAMASQGTLLMQKRIQSGEVLKLFDDLMKSDPSHAGYYEDGRSLVLIDQVTSDKESLLKHYWHFNYPTSSSFHHHACLRLNKLSLTRIGFLERLLWVQILDLSYNKLRSIEGLEALQLLTCLNLSNNRISSFTALEPLKLLVSLKTLDISFNEIGAHPVDTTRYLCSSPLSCKKAMVWDIDEYQTENINIVDHWQTIFLFKDLHLRQLDVKGNAVAGENLKVVLTNVLPTLKWLDDERVR